MTVQRIIGTETEYGIYRLHSTQDPVWLSTEIVDAYAQISRDNTPAQAGMPVRWDYTAEDPLNDLRGTRLSRAAADPSQLTDDPYHLAPSGGEEFLGSYRHETSYLPAATSAVLTNGARLYVDHAHPEYSAPETLGPLDAVLWDRAGDVIARRMMAQIQALGKDPIVLVKNNTDGKGAAYGTHENYQMRRDVDLDDLVRALTPFLISRPVICGSGRLGLGQHSEEPGFQISQRADFVESHVGLETTFNRPIVNMRDEPHADPRHFRRLHVIGGDANLFDVSAYLRFGTTSLVLWAIEAGVGLEWDAISVSDPVPDVWGISHSPELTYKVNTLSGSSYTAVELQQVVLDLVMATYDRLGTVPAQEDAALIALWQDVLDRMRTNVFSVATEVEWVAKYQLLLRQKERLGAQWDDPRLVAMDLQWADLRPGKSLVERLDQAGLVRRLFTPAQVEWAADNAPSNTRAAIRGAAVAQNPNLVQASWTSLVTDEPQRGGLVRRPLPDAYQTS